MLKAIIIEDEKTAQKLLQRILNDYCPKVNFTGQASHLSEAVNLIETSKPDVIFMDIDLADCNAFEILESISFSDYQIIFTTAYQEYAHKAFRYEAIDYILKPYAPKDVISAIDRIKTKDYDKSILNRLTSVVPNNKSSSKICISTSKGIMVIQQADIINVEADGSYSRVFTREDSMIMCSKGLKDIEARLSSREFIRIHQSHLVNINHIREYIKENGGLVTMSDGKSLPVSRRKRADLLELLALGI